MSQSILRCVFCDDEIGRGEGYMEFYDDDGALTGLGHEQCLQMVVDANGGPAYFGYILGPDGTWCHESLWSEIWSDVDMATYLREQAKEG